MLLAGCSRPAETGPPPKFVLWAWDRAEDLRFLKPGEAEVAVLAGTLWANQSTQERMRWRQMPLEVNEGTRVWAVIRIESDGTKPLVEPSDVASWIQLEYRRHPYVGLQLDFDARESEREWYRRVREAIGDRTISGAGIGKLSMTAIASWCLEQGAPVADGTRVSEIVPMLFRMGPARMRTLEAIGRQGGFSGACGGGASIGVSTDEPLAWTPPGVRRVYLFHPLRWTKEAFEQACARWQ